MNRVDVNERDDWLVRGDEALTALCDLDFFKATGKGGQKRNKSSSAVRVVHRSTGVAVTASSSRSQHDNRRAALRKLRMALALRFRFDPPPRRKRFPTKINPKNPEFPLWTARLLDVLARYDYRLRESADHAGLSVNQLTRLASADPALWQTLNEARHQRGLSALKTR